MVVLTPTKMGQAEEMRKRGLSYDKIGKELEASGEAVRRRLLAAAERGDLYPRSPPGPPPLPIREVHKIHRDLVRYPWKTWRAIGKDHGVGYKRVRAVAMSHFLYRFISRNKPFLKPKARQARLRWMREVQNTDWTSLIWTDESMVRIGDRGRRWVTRPKGQADNPLYVTPTLRQDQRVIAWGAISYGRKYPLVKIDLTHSKLNGQRYVDEILRPHLSKHLNYLRRYGQRHARAVEDGAPVHWRKCDMETRRELKIGVRGDTMTSTSID